MNDINIVFALLGIALMLTLVTYVMVHDRKKFAKKQKKLDEQLETLRKAITIITGH